ncbi:alanine--tRNA ligase-related protein [Actinomadura sediminis]|uniref:Alanine--tRNA ligase-related protein n=1 Tax=Actinomadura sediminis TaxID=1038904 RepID=A0ABW3EP72_9ACTN
MNAHGRTARLELDDQDLREWEAIVLESGPDGIVLDRSAFYPGGGGQPPDHGVLLWQGVQTRIAGVRKGDDLVRIVGLDTQADGGTHVASTKQIGRITVAKVENKGRGFRRLRIKIAD